MSLLNLFPSIYYRIEKRSHSLLIGIVEARHEVEKSCWPDPRKKGEAKQEKNWYKYARSTSTASNKAKQNRIENRFLSY